MKLEELASDMINGSCHSEFYALFVKFITSHALSHPSTPPPGIESCVTFGPCLSCLHTMQQWELYCWLARHTGIDKALIDCHTHHHHHCTHDIRATTYSSSFHNQHIIHITDRVQLLYFLSSTPQLQVIKENMHMPETGGGGWEELQLNYLINLICAIYVSSILDFQMTLIDVRQSNVFVWCFILQNYCTVDYAYLITVIKWSRPCGCTNPCFNMYTTCNASFILTHIPNNI